jgi:uncharacterized membrane protein YhaH (DUF805 family)
MNRDMKWLLLSFEGRLNRKPFWLWVLASLIIASIAQIIDGREPGPVTAIVALLLIWPWLATTAKRLHDTDRSGWWMLIVFVPLIGGIWLLVLEVLRGTPGPNRYGPDPLADEPPLV